MVEKTVVEDGLTESERKGRQFEERVVSQFPKPEYTIKEWRTNKYRKPTEALLSLYRYHLTDEEKQWIARQLTTDMADLRKSE